MIDKKNFFLKDKQDNLPFFLRNYEIKELKALKNPDEVTVLYNDEFPIYHSETVECKLSLKPISKLLTFDEQKKF